VLRLRALRLAPPRLDHLPHDRAALLGSSTRPPSSLGLPGRSFAAQATEGHRSRVLPLRHVRDFIIGVRSYSVIIERTCSAICITNRGAS
jgi:hypothetical protein